MPAIAPTNREDLVSLRRAARERGTTYHRVLVAVAEGKLRTGRMNGRLAIVAASLRDWSPELSDRAPSAA